MSIDRSAQLLLQGYTFWSRVRRGADAARTRLLGRPALVTCSPAGAQLPYDEALTERHSAMPGAVQRTLTGRGGVQSLDGPAHRHRKAMFLAVTTPPPSIDDLVERTARAWDDAAARWSTQPEVRLFDEAAQVLMRGVCDWAGVPLPERDLPARAADMVAMVDGFGSAGPAHVRARLARARSERWAAAVVAGARRRTEQLAPPLRAVSEHRDPDGTLLPTHVAGIELLNLLRPTVAVCWYVAFAVHPLDVEPALARRLATADEEYAEAFVHELRRYYPFAPAVGARARVEIAHRGERVPPGAMVLADVYGQHHDPGLWDEPEEFRPERFLGREIGEFELIPQGGGDPATGHRCAGERITIELLKALCRKLAAMDYELPPQRLDYSLRRIPTRPRSGCVLRGVRVPVPEAEKSA